MGPPTDQKERKRLLSLSQFVLSRKSEDLREELYEHMVKQSLHDNDKDARGLRPYDMKRFLEEDFGLAKIPIQALETASSRLLDRGEVIAVGNGFALSYGKSTELAESLRRFTETRGHVIQTIVASVRSRVPIPIDPKEVDEAFFMSLGDVFRVIGAASAKGITGRAVEGMSPVDAAEIEPLISIRLGGVREPSVRDALREEFVKSLSNPDENLTKVISALAQSQVLANVLSLDPELKSLEQRSLSSKTLYLDTNILFSLFCSSAATHSVVERVLRLTTKLGVKIVCTTRTKKEFLAALHESSRTYSGYENLRDSAVLRKIQPLMEDSFIASYWKELESNPGLTWSGFTGRMGKFADVLRNAYGIDVEDRNYPQPQTDESLGRLALQIKRQSYLKSPGVVEHDAFHIMLVRYERKQQSSDELGLKTWFLTLDHTLSTAEVKTYGPDVVSNSVYIDVWTDMISPFLTPSLAGKDAAESMSRLMASEFVMVTSRINPRDVLDLLGPWINDADLDTESLRQIIGDTYVKERLQKWREGKRTGHQPPLSEIIQPIVDRAVKEYKRKQDTKMRNVEERLKTVESVSTQRIRRHLVVNYLLVIVLYALFDILLVTYYPPPSWWQLPGLAGIELSVLFGVPRLWASLKGKPK